MFSALYGASRYGGAEYGRRSPAAYTAAIGEGVTASALWANVMDITPTPSLRTFLIPTEKRNLL